MRRRIIGFRHRETRPTTKHWLLQDFNWLCEEEERFLDRICNRRQFRKFYGERTMFWHYSRGGLWAPKIIIHIIVKIPLHIIYLFKPFEAYWNPHKQTVKGLTQSKRLFAQSWWRDFGLLFLQGIQRPGAVSLSYKPEFFIVTLAFLRLKDMLRKTTPFAKAPLSRNIG